MTEKEYAADLFEEAGNDFKQAKEICCKRAYDNMMLGAARPMVAIDKLFDTAVELVRLADSHAAKAKVDECATEFKARYGELFAR